MTWMRRIDESLGNRKSYTAEQRDQFAHVLLRVVPQAIQYSEIAVPKNTDVKKVKATVKK